MVGPRVSLTSWTYRTRLLWHPVPNYAGSSVLILHLNWHNRAACRVTSRLNHRLPTSQPHGNVPLEGGTHSLNNSQILQKQSTHGCNYKNWDQIQLILQAECIRCSGKTSFTKKITRCRAEPEVRHPSDPKSSEQHTPSSHGVAGTNSTVHPSGREVGQVPPSGNPTPINKATSKAEYTNTQQV